VKTSLIIVTVLLVTACAAKHDELQTYVGEDIQKVVADYGQPHLAYDMGGDRRDFQWIMKSATVPSYDVSSGALTDPATQSDPAIKSARITPMYDGKQVATECLLTMVTRWDEDTKSWVVTGYQQPTSGC